MKLVFSVLAASLLVASPAIAKTFKVGTMIPEGTSWANNIKKMTKEIKKATDGRVKFKVYYGGVAGDEPDVLRKIRSGQFHGGTFTGKSLGDINGDFRLLELPFNFQHDRSKALKVMNGMKNHLNSGFKKAGFKALGYYEMGKVYVVSKNKIKNIDDMKGVKIWAFEGDPLVENIMTSLKLVATPLALPDVTTSLSTGMIEAAYGPPLGIIALQWQSKVKYLLDQPLAYVFAGFVLGEKSWNKISKADRAKVESITAEYTAKANDINIQENVKSLEVLKQQKIEFVKPADVKKETAIGHKVREEVLAKLTGKLFTKEGRKIYDGLMK